MEPLISLTIAKPDRMFQAGDELEYEFQVDAVSADEVLAVEASVLWYTEGKGDEDFGVHHFERRTAAEQRDTNICELQRIRTRLPNSPLSYDGTIVKIHWCVRVRVFLKAGKEIFFEQPFKLQSKSEGDSEP